MALGISLSIKAPTREEIDGKGRLIRAMLFGRRDYKKDSFEQQAERVFSSVFGTALRLTRSREEAEDLL